MQKDVSKISCLTIAKDYKKMGIFFLINEHSYVRAQKKEFKELILIGSCVRKQVSDHSVNNFKRSANKEEIKSDC